MLRTCPKARGFVLIDYLFATWLMSLLCFFILEAFSLGLWWTRTWEPGPTLKRSCVILPLQVRRLPFWIPICGWKQSESFLNCPRSRNGRQPSMNGLVGGFLPAWYAMKKDKGFVAFECMLFVLLFALLISLCARAGGRFVALSSKLLSSWELRRAAVDLDCRFEHYFRYEALAVSIRKGSSAMCWSYGPVPRIKRSSTMRRPRPNLEGKPFTSAPRKE